VAIRRGASEGSCKQMKVGAVMSIAFKNLGSDQLRLTEEETLLVQSLNAFELTLMRRRCMRRAREWKRVANLLREVAMGRGQTQN
jgi:hypothetical protein